MIRSKMIVVKTAAPCHMKTTEVQEDDDVSEEKLDWTNHDPWRSVKKILQNLMSLLSTTVSRSEVRQLIEIMMMRSTS